MNEQATTEPQESPQTARPLLSGELGFALHDLPPEGSALRKLGKRLAELLDEDQWAECEQMIFEVSDEMENLRDLLVCVTHHDGALKEYEPRWLPIVQDELKRRMGVPN